jgi:hypothetical protein
MMCVQSWETNAFKALPSISLDKISPTLAWLVGMQGDQIGRFFFWQFLNMYIQ